MNSPELYIPEVNARFEETGFDRRPLDQLDFHKPHEVTRENSVPTRYVVHGDIHAQNVLFEGTPYLTPVDKPHYRLRLEAQSVALGEDWCVVGVEAYANDTFALPWGARKQLRKGNFSHLAERTVGVIEDVRMNDDQNAYLYGYSLGADAMTQTANDMTTDSNKGIRRIDGLGAIEFARSITRSLGAVTTAMSNSGKDLARNITDSNVSALEQAWKIYGLSLTKAHAKIDRSVMLGLPSYFGRAPLSNIAMTRAFATDASVAQLRQIAKDRQIPHILAGRYVGSTVCDEGGFNRINHSLDAAQRVNTSVQEGDHSSDDNIRASAARVLYFASVCNPGRVSS